MSTHNLAIATVESMKRWSRKAADTYPTPAECTVALIEALALPKGTTIEEPACGDGRLARVLKLYGYDVIASDLRHTGYGKGGTDYLQATEKTAALWTITNPPFDLAEEFVRKALSRTPNVAMLLKSNYWHAARCLSLFEQHRPTMEYRLTWRPAFLQKERGDNPLMDVSWIVWRGDRTGPAAWRPLRRPREAPILEPLLSTSLAALGEALEELTDALRP